MTDPVDAWRRSLRSSAPAARRRFYLDSGQGNRAVVLLHGIPTSSVLWREVVEHLSPELRVLAPDLTGFGLSELPPEADLSPSGQALDLLSWLDEIRMRKFAVVGHDYGALVAFELLALCPERVTHLAVTNTSLRREDWSGSGLNPFRLLRLPIVGELAFSMARPAALKAAFSIYVAERERLDRETMALYWAPFERGFDRTLLALFRQRSLDEGDISRWRAALRSFERPALVVWGARDPTFRVDRGVEIHKLLPDSELFVLQGSNHFVPIDRPRVLARLVRRLAGSRNSTPNHPVGVTDSERRLSRVEGNTSPSSPTVGEIYPSASSG